MAEPSQNLNQQPPVRPTQVKSWLTTETMSPLGRELMEIAAEIDVSDDTPLDEEAIERELIKRRGGYSADGE
ncbi:MAG: hypothetical protein QOG23_1022 [Blastocatellia bacterium]|jgi:hypothetical protein|nr:hypothetical protein [Blastocatellia bacterium]